MCARAARRLRSAGLTYFFFPRALVADLRALADFALDDFVEADFFLLAVDPALEVLASDDPASADPDAFFLWLVDEAVAFVALALGAS